MNRAPAFLLYAKDWFDFKVKRMSREAQSVYMDILCYMWKDSKDQYSISKDKKSLAKVLGLSNLKFEKILTEIQNNSDPLFEENETHYISKRLKEEALKQQEHSLQKSIAGKVGMEKRWGKKNNGSYTPIT